MMGALTLDYGFRVRERFAGEDVVFHDGDLRMISGCRSYSQYRFRVMVIMRMKMKSSYR